MDFLAHRQSGYPDVKFSTIVADIQRIKIKSEKGQYDLFATLPKEKITDNFKLFLNMRRTFCLRWAGSNRFFDWQKSNLA